MQVRFSLKIRKIILALITFIAYSILYKPNFGASPSGKAADFDSAIRRFESFRPSNKKINYDSKNPIYSWNRRERNTRN
jgi:hypothetical protein